jgi:CRISPR-associated exonuclease Cas4
MRGREIHDLRLVQNKDYLRKKIGVVNKWLDQYLSIKGLRGIVDEVLQLNDGTFAPLDYKFAEWEDVLYETYRQQLFCYATLIEVNFKAQVNRGFLIYTRSKNKLIEVDITEQNKQNIKKSIVEMLDIIEKNKFPKGTKNKKKCINCTYRNICIK